jgi:hypothetical protein
MTKGKADSQALQTNLSSTRRHVNQCEHHAMSYSSVWLQAQQLNSSSQTSGANHKLSYKCK